MAELYDKTSEDKNALQKSTTLKEDVKWKKKDNKSVTVIQDMANQAESLSEGTAAAPFVKAGINLLCAVMNNDNNDNHEEIKRACEKIKENSSF